MTRFKIYAIIFLSAIFMTHTLCAQTIAEKKAGVNQRGDLSAEMEKYLDQMNYELNQWQLELNKSYAQVLTLFENNAPEIDYKKLLDKINLARNHIIELETAWRQAAKDSSNVEPYALWQQPETTIGQIVIDYGSYDFVYVMSPEIFQMKISVNSDLPIPKASWNEMLELLLNTNGIGIRTLNPYLRQLYLYKNDSSNIRLITNDRRDLNVLPKEARIAFVLSPQPQELRRLLTFLEKFINATTTTMHVIGRDIFIIGSVGEIQDLLKLYDFAESIGGDKDFFVTPLKGVDPEEMAKILSTIFQNLIQEAQSEDSGAGANANRPQNTPSSRMEREHSSLVAIPLKNIAQAIFLIGTPEEIRKAQSIIKQVQSQIGEGRQKVIYNYHVKHCDADDIAKILERVYTLMVKTGVGYSTPPGPPPPPGGPQDINDNLGPGTSISLSLPPTVQIPPPPPPPLSSQQLYSDGFYQEGGFIINPAPIEPGVRRFRPSEPDRGNFIVDSKGGSIVMVVEADILPRLKELIQKLDVPKKMVRIEVMLFELRINESNNFGLNLLRIGDAATNTHNGSAIWNDTAASANNVGLFQFLLSRKKTCSGFPAFDLAYNFLLSRTDASISATPSVVTLNQTPAIIAINEEISINTGIFEVETAKGVTLKDAFTRAQYGITIEVTPTIHMSDDENDKDYSEGVRPYITLRSDITFDTLASAVTPDQPDVTRRHITNEARIPDGQTIILGGLRRKNMTDTKNVIPFIGELPGIGKLFSTTAMQDDSTEMFIFMTPKIISNPEEEYERIKWQEMHRRPGDIHDFLAALKRSRDAEKNQLMEHAMMMLLGREADRVIHLQGEYDGR